MRSGWTGTAPYLLGLDLPLAPAAACCPANVRLRDSLEHLSRVTGDDQRRRRIPS